MTTIDKPKKMVLNKYQAGFLAAKEQYVGLFGGVGNGKTTAGCLAILEHTVRNPNNLCLIGRLTYPELRDSTREVFMTELAKLYPKDAYRVNLSENSVSFPWRDNSKVIFRHLDDHGALLGPNLGAFYIDQAEEVDEDAFLTLQSRLRRNGCKHRQGYVSGNPLGHDWVYYKFGMHEGWNEDRHERNWLYGNNYRMFTAPTTINADNLPPDYETLLKESYSKDWYNRYVLGSWDGFEGMVFDISKIQSYETLPEMVCIVTGADPAISKENNACNTCYCTLGMGADGYIYDIETIADHWNFLEQLEIGCDLVKRNKTQYFGVEDVAYQSALTEALRATNPEIRVDNIKADRDKIRRARSVSHMIGRGLFRTNNKELLNEMIAFDPDAKGKAKKDRVDALVHALHMIQMYAPIKVVEPNPQEAYQGLTASQAWFKRTREYDRKSQAGTIDDEVFNETFGDSVDSDFY